MGKKILIGMFAVFAVIALATAGYHFGRGLAQAERTAAAQQGRNYSAGADSAITSPCRATRCPRAAKASASSTDA